MSETLTRSAATTGSRSRGGSPVTAAWESLLGHKPIQWLQHFFGRDHPFPCGISVSES